MRKFVDDYLFEDAQVRINSLEFVGLRVDSKTIFVQAREADGKRPSQAVIDKMAELQLHAMRMGRGKHLQGRKLFNGIVTPEEVSSDSASCLTYI